jgi:hypothetical protein
LRIATSKYDPENQIGNFALKDDSLSISFHIRHASACRHTLSLREALSASFLKSRHSTLIHFTFLWCSCGPREFSCGLPSPLQPCVAHLCFERALLVWFVGVTSSMRTLLHCLGAFKGFPPLLLLFVGIQGFVLLALYCLYFLYFLYCLWAFKGFPPRLGALTKAKGGWGADDWPVLLFVCSPLELSLVVPVRYSPLLFICALTTLSLHWLWATQALCVPLVVFVGNQCGLSALSLSTACGCSRWVFDQFFLPLLS